jgi:hypothetical protein
MTGSGESVLVTDRSAVGAVTVSCRSNVRVKFPSVPTTWKVDDPGLAFEPTFTVNVLVIDSLAGGVTGLGLKLQATPAGWPLQDSVTALLKPLSEVTVQLLVPLPPCARLNEDGLELTLKSGVPIVADLVTVTATEPIPAGKGDPGIAVRTPVVASIVYPETSLLVNPPKHPPEFDA